MIKLNPKTIRRTVAVSLFLLGLSVFSLVVTYYSYIDWVIYNTSVMMNVDSVTLEIKNAAIQLYNGHPIKLIDNTVVISIAFLSLFVMYLGALIFMMNKKSLLNIFTKRYWTNFTLLPK
jgi:hypothetical protein